LSITLRPPATAWRAALSRSPNADAQTFRRELGLPATGPILMSGHQPGLWHPGILAKWLAMVHGSALMNAHAAWVVVDHDEVAPMRVRLPMKAADGSLRAAEFDLSAAQYPPDRPAHNRPASRVAAPQLKGEQYALDGVGAGVDAMIAACDAFATASSAAEQIALATSRLIHDSTQGVLHGSPAPTIFLATHLSRTSAFRMLVKRMVADPIACAKAYNDAAAAHPHARMRPLRIAASATTGPTTNANTNATELPVWILRDGKRVPATAASLASIITSENAWPTIVPRALFLTLLLRLHGCEMFIHGLGGGGTDEGEGYEEVMRDWATRWLGNVHLAPLATVSATLRLPFELTGREVSHEDATRATWAAWHARNDPAALGEQQLAARKKSLISEIAALPRHDPRRRTLWHELRSLVADAQSRHAPDLARLADVATSARASAKQDAVRLERTWPFAIYPAASLLSLSRQIRERLRAERGT
jgi:hypothetical protein